MTTEKKKQVAWAVIVVLLAGVTIAVVMRQVIDAFKYQNAVRVMIREDDQRVAPIQEKLGDQYSHEFEFITEARLKDGNLVEVTSRVNYGFAAQNTSGKNYLLIAGDPQERLEQFISVAVRTAAARFVSKDYDSPDGLKAWEQLLTEKTILSMNEEKAYLPYNCQTPTLTRVETILMKFGEK